MSGEGSDEGYCGRERLAATPQGGASTDEGKGGLVQQQHGSKQGQDHSGDVHAPHPSGTLWGYFQERFPPHLVTMLAVSFGAACVALFGPWDATDIGLYAHLALFAVLYVALLLRYRVVDEWKDFRHDSRHYPDRPVQRGAITPRVLAVLGVTAVVVEFSLAWLLGGAHALPLYAIVTALTVGTAVDFGAREFFERHFSIAFVIHQLVYPAMFAWAAVALGASLTDASTWWGIAAASSLFISAEVVRKFQPRTSAQGGTVADTYGAVWGRRLALMGLIALVVAAGAFAHFAVGSWFALSVSIAAGVVIAVRHQSDTWVMAGAGAHVPLLAIAMVI